MTARQADGGIPRARRPLAARPVSVAPEESWPGANDAKVETLRRNDLKRRARTSGLELRHSAYGYALIDAARKPVHDRHDMTLDDVEACLAEG